VRGDAAGLATTLLSIGADAGVVVVVAVDGPDPEIEAEARSLGADVVVLPEPAGSYDAGCVVAPRWIAAHVRALDGGADLSGGAVQVPLPSWPSAAEYVDAQRNLRQEAYVNEGGYAATCNLAVRREVLDRVRFDAGLRSGGDREFCHRATAAGFALAYTADALVVHPPRQSWRAVLGKAARVGDGVHALPAPSRPASLAPPRFGFGLARGHQRGQGLAGVPWALQVAALDYLRTRAFVRAAR
jgi:hypothetical protein